MPGALASGYADLLTRTTLQTDVAESAASVLRLVAALQRVPGVLFAEMTAGTDRAVVAHDPAVDATSLLAAAAASGVHARILCDTRTIAPGPGAPPGADIPARRLATLALLLVFQLALTEALFPNFVSRHLIIPVLLLSLWAFLMTRRILKR